MTSKLKCPFCGGELYGCIGHPYCRNEKCEMCDEMMPQELLDLLDSTRKDLEIARQALDKADRFFEGIIGLYQSEMMAIIKTALEQIEHKE